MSLIHTLSASVLHGINETDDGANRSSLACCLGKLNPAAFSRPRPIAALTDAKAIIGDPSVVPIDVIAIKSSTCRESMFSEYEAIRLQRNLEEIGKEGGVGASDNVELATTMRQRQMERNPFSRYSESRLRRFACTAFNGCEVEPENASANLVLLTSSSSFAPLPYPSSTKNDGTSSDSLLLAPYATTVRNRKNVYYRSPWSNLHQSIIDVPSITRALHDEIEIVGDDSCGDEAVFGAGRASGISTPVAGGDCPGPLPGLPSNSTPLVCPIFVKYQREAMALFSNKQITQQRHISDTFSTPERTIAARNVEAQLNAMLTQYLDAYYISAVEMPTAVNTTSAGGQARLGPAPRNLYGETIKTYANVNDHDFVASAFVRDFSFERTGQARQHVLEVNTVIRNRVKVEAKDEWEGEFCDEDEGGEEEGNDQKGEHTSSNSDPPPSLRRLRSSTERVMRLALGSAVPSSLAASMKKSDSSNNAVKRAKPKPPHRSWTAVHTAVLRQHNKEVKIAASSRLLLRQTTRAPIATVLHHAHPAEEDRRKGHLDDDDEEDDGLDVDPIGLYGRGDGSITGSVLASASVNASGLFPTARGGGSAALNYGAALATARGGGEKGASVAGPLNPYPNLVIETDAALSHMYWSSTVFHVGKDEDVLASQPAAVAQMIGDAIQNTENEGLVPLLLDVLSGNTATMIRGVLPPPSPSTKIKSNVADLSHADGDVVLEATGEAGSGSSDHGPSVKFNRRRKLPDASGARGDGGEYAELEVADDRAIALRFPLATSEADAASKRRSAAVEAASMCASQRNIVSKRQM